MTKAKVTKLPKEEPQEGLTLFQIPTQWGNVQAVKHTYNGKQFVQQEVDSDQAKQVSKLLLRADIFGCVDISDLNEPKIDLGTVVSKMVNEDLTDDFLCIVLRHEDGSVPSPNDFKGRATAYVALIEEVWTYFFTLNPSLTARIGTLFMKGLGLSVGALSALAQLRDGMKSAGQSANTDRKQGR